MMKIPAENFQPEQYANHDARKIHVNFAEQVYRDWLMFFENNGIIM